MKIKNLLILLPVFIFFSGCSLTDTAGSEKNSGQNRSPDPGSKGSGKIIKWHMSKPEDTRQADSNNADSFEDDDTAALAQLYVVNSSARAHTFYDDPVDWIKFTAVAGKSYTLETWTYGYADTELYLYEENDLIGEIAYNDDKPGGTSYDSVLSWTCISDGTYYLKIASFGGDTGPDNGYLVAISDNTISCDAYEDDDSFDNAQELFTNEIQDHNFADDYVDFFSFSASPDYTYRFDSILEGADTVFSLYDDAGNLLQYDDDGGYGLASLLFFTPKTSGTYYLKAGSYNGFTGTGEKYSIKMTGSDRIKKWTVMVYLSGDNDLHNAGIEDVNEMITAGSTDEINIVVLWDGADSPTHGYYYIEKDRAVLLEDIGEVNMGDESTAKTFIDYVTQNYPAEHYFIDFWNHGGGPDRSAPANLSLSLAIQKGICWDYTSNDFLSDIELRNVMSYFKEKIGRNINIIGFDACLMATLEIAYQVSDSADYMIASEDDEPFEGWDYKFLQELQNNADVSADVLARHVGNYYKDFYPDSTPLTLSVFDLSKVNNIVSSLDNYCNSVITSDIASSMFSNMHNMTICFGNYTSDLTGYMENIIASTSLPESIKSNASNVISAINDVVIFKWNNEYPKTVNGISISLKSDTPTYSLLDLCQNTKWNEYLTFCNLGD